MALKQPTPITLSDTGTDTRLALQPKNTQLPRVLSFVAERSTNNNTSQAAKHNFPTLVNSGGNATAAS
jgi:hypothetical protein